MTMGLPTDRDGNDLRLKSSSTPASHPLPQAAELEGKAKAALAYLLEKIVYSDSYGVQGSEFQCCHMCSGGGAPNIPFKHDEDCPALKCESIGNEWWSELHEELEEVNTENEKLREQLAATPAQPPASEAVKPLDRWIRHDDDCVMEQWNGKGPMRCSCGLYAAQDAFTGALEPGAALERVKVKINPNDPERVRSTCRAHNNAVDDCMEMLRRSAATPAQPPAAEPLEAIYRRFDAEKAEITGKLFDALKQLVKQTAALKECEEILAIVAQPAFVDPDYEEEVAALGNRIGYGALMSSASASWRERLEAEDCPTGGEFVAGPCFKTVTLLLAKVRSALTAEQGIS